MYVQAESHLWLFSFAHSSHTPVFWPGGLHGLYGPWGRSGTRLSHLHFHFAHTNPPAHLQCMHASGSAFLILLPTEILFKVLFKVLSHELFPRHSNLGLFQRILLKCQSYKGPLGAQGQLCYAITAILCLEVAYTLLNFHCTSTLSTVHKFPLSNSYRDIFVLNIIKVDYHRLIPHSQAVLAISLGRKMLYPF